MDCSFPIGEQLDALTRLARRLMHDDGSATRRLAWRELMDRAAAHFHVREKVVLETFRQAGWKGMNSDALAAHLQLKRALAALCICPPGEPDFGELLQRFNEAVAHQRGADELWIVPALRMITTGDQRRAICEEIEQLYDTLVPPASHYLDSEHLAEDAAVVLSSLAGGGDGRGAPMPS